MPVSRLARPIARGDVVLVAFPFTDLSTTKRRPAVVLRADPAQSDFVLAFIGTREIVRAGVGEVPLLPNHPEFGLTGLVAPSKIHANKLVTLSGTLMRRWLGRLGPLILADLDRALIAALSINPVPYREEGRRDERVRLAALHTAGGAAALLGDLGLVLA
jgi:mRNA interferase MazF